MPIFEYNCEKHGSFEEFNHQHDRDTGACPECSAACPRVFPSEIHHKEQRYVPPPKATRKLGDERKTAHRRKRWS